MRKEIGICFKNIDSIDKGTLSNAEEVPSSDPEQTPECSMCSRSNIASECLHWDIRYQGEDKPLINLIGWTDEQYEVIEGSYYHSIQSIEDYITEDMLKRMAELMAKNEPESKDFWTSDGYRCDQCPEMSEEESYYNWIGDIHFELIPFCWGL
jgi:hypothetical protein